MGFIPDRLVNSGLYTAASEYLDATTGKSYAGSYHELFTGEAYTGKDQYSPNKRLLIKNPSKNVEQTNVLNSREAVEYAKLNTSNQELYKFGVDPEPYTPNPTGEDYKRGKITRYFAKKRNQTPTYIIEITQSTFNDLSGKGGRYNYALWEPIQLFWKITGPINNSRDEFGVIQAGIYNTNKRIVNQAQQQMRGIKGYLFDLLEFALKADLELVFNKYTGGNEFTVKLDNSDYIGYYHIMADGTIMDGAEHGQSTGKILLAGDSLVQSQINTLIKEALEQVGSSSTQPTQQPQETVDPPPQVSTFTSPPTTGGSSSY